ncbi:MAG: hypothetical protein FJZ87_15120 [Chloroflexi bacterium]|nr:hypothetical protein [Chloroflexota bacterium]
MKRIGKYLGRVFIGTLILILIVGVGVLYYFKFHLPKIVAQQSFPLINGEIQLEGLDGPVDIYRDPMGIPHIYGTTTHDLYWARSQIAVLKGDEMRV